MQNGFLNTSLTNTMQKNLNKMCMYVCVALYTVKHSKKGNIDYADYF